MHWSSTRDADGICWLTLDCAGASVNTLSAAVLAEFSQVLLDLEAHPPRALIIRSGKAAGFIAGADLQELRALDSTTAARALVQRGWDLFNRLAAFKIPTLALIHGHCLGGGLELALACRYRIVIDSSATRLALPEVMVGLVPGWGGMLRLPRVVGPSLALDMMLSGKTLDARRAAQSGLADACVPERIGDHAARSRVLSGLPPRRISLAQRLLAGPFKPVVVMLAKRALIKRASREHYPAPWAVLDLWAHHQGNALQAPAMLDALVSHPTTKNLLRVFFLQERLKSLAGDADFRPRRVHVIGAGTMGGDIAAWCALQGMTVSLQDHTIERIAPAMARAGAMLAKKFRGDARRIRSVLDRLIPDPQGEGVKQADVVIEAIFENLDAKHALFRTIEPQLKPGAVLATNTSSLKLEDIATALKDPARLVGIHFFNPVARMPLVEVVRASTTDAQHTARALQFVRAIDKLPLPVKSAPVFLVNAVLGPYLHEAMRAIDEGLAPEAIDRAATDFGMPMGPIELIDTVGLDIAQAAGAAITHGAPPPRCLTERLASGHLGKKTGQGFYRWHQGHPQKRAISAPPELARRLIEPLMAAAARTLKDGVVEDPDLIDAGVIFGTGFAPWTGGPLHFQRVASNIKSW